MLINPDDVDDVSCTSTIMLIELYLINEQWMERKKTIKTFNYVCFHLPFFSLALSS